MQLSHIKSVSTPPSNDGILKVTALCWSPNGKKLAVCTTDRVVLMYDENGELKDKFPTKPAEKGPKNYIVRQMVFSQQSDRLAIAQTDNMVFIYKIGNEWGDKKSICNKFQHSSPVTSIAWPSKRPNEIVYGLAEGHVKVGKLKVEQTKSKTHNVQNLYESKSYVTAICCNSNGNAVCSAHLDGAIYTYWFEGPSSGGRRICQYPSVPFALAWGTSIVVAGSDAKVTFYNDRGAEELSFDYSSDSNCREFTTAISNPTGDAVVLGNFNSFHTFAKNKGTMEWEEKGVTTVENMYSVTALDWNSDGSKIAVGTLCGIVDLYDVCVNRIMFKGGFELTHVSHSQAIIRHIETNNRLVLRSKYEILKTNLYQQRFVISHTTNTLLLGDIETGKISEIEWDNDCTEKFIFDNPYACVIYFAEEITIVEYGIDDTLGSVRTPHINSHVLSLRINERRSKNKNSSGQEGVLANGRLVGGGDRFSRGSNNNDDIKKIAFLLDSQTICIKDLVTQTSIQIPHDTKIDWLELNGRADLLLFRDKKHILYKFDIDTQIRQQLLNFCTYVQWVPDSDVVVAQNRSNLCVWYNIQAPDQFTLHAIKGDVETIERTDGKTLVIVDEGLALAEYPLDEPLINFGTAVDDLDFLHAMEILEELEMTIEAEAMWHQLCSLCIKAGQISIAERCAAATGDISMSSYLNNINTLKVKAEEEMGIRGDEHFMVRTKLALLDKDLQGAEEVLLSQGKVDICIEMYQKLHKHDAAIHVAEVSRHPDLMDMRQAYYQYLLDSNQEEEAAALKVHEMDFVKAIELYLKGGMPAKAAQVIKDQEIRTKSTIDGVATALTRAGMHDVAGELYELLDDLPRAMDCYIRGNAFRPALELARKAFPARVVELEEKYGDLLVSQKQLDMAISHYIEAKATQKAIEAALNAKQHSRALQLLDNTGSEAYRPYYKQIARYYEEIGQYEIAQRCFVNADQPQLAVEMLTHLGRWEKAYNVATQYMSESEVGVLYVSQAQKLESEGKFKEAEKLYLTVKEKDLAINMYKKHRRFEDMVRLVNEHRPDLLKETHQFLAQTLEMDGSLREAEHHYVEAGEWHSAVNMYRSNEMWDDSIRVAKFYGGVSACKRVTIALLMAVGVAEGSKYLIKHGLVDAAIEHATENGAFDMAFELATQNLPKKLSDIHMKHALFLEDDERFKEAEEEFVKAGKPREAIDMYIHQQDWTSALCVAEKNDPAAVGDVYIAHAKSKSDGGNHKGAEDLYLTASRPDLALAMYQENAMWTEALRVAKLHLPHRVAEVTMSYNSNLAKTGSKGGSKTDYLTTARTHEAAKQWQQAIDAYMIAQRDNIDNIADLDEIWGNALEIARKHLPNKYVEVGLEVSRRLKDLQQEEAAAEVLWDIGRNDEAITLLLDVRKFEKAKALAKGNPVLKRRVEEAHQGHLVVNEDAKELVLQGRADAALDVLANRGDWEHLWDVAAKEKLSTSVLGRYVLMRVEDLLKDDKLAEESTIVERQDEAVKVLSKKPGLTTDAATRVYTRLVQTILGRSKDMESLSDQGAIVHSLRDVLYKLAVGYRAQTKDRDLPADFQKLLMATHYQSMYYKCKEHGLKDTAVKCAVTMLKYPDIVPQDKAFYIAGNASKDAGNKNLAFMLLNRYVDLSEAIDTGDYSMIDNGDYNEADDIPLDGPPSSFHYLPNEDAREDVRTWVLTVVTDSSIDQQFPHREAAKNTLYDGLFSSERPTCIVSGYPVYSADLLDVNNSKANRKDWNAFVAKQRTCPWTGQSQNPIY